MTLEDLKQEARPILEREQKQAKVNRDNFFRELAGLKWSCATPNYCSSCRYRYECRQSTIRL